MTRPAWNPRLPEPLPAVLVGAGFFLFLAALTRPFGPAAPVGGAAAGAAPASVLTAERVWGGPPPAGDGAKVDALARDLAWLRSQGAGVIVLEAWLDETPQAGERALNDELRARFEALPAGRARKRALQVLSATAQELDAPQRLSAALRGAQPLLLAFQAVPGAGVSLPAGLKSQAYLVSLRGEAKTLPPYLPLRLPFDGALRAADRVAALPPALGSGGVTAVVCVGGHWIDSLGLEAARLALDLPLQGLRYRWHLGLLNSLELADRRYGLDEAGRLLLTPEQRGRDLPQGSMDSLRRDPVEAGRLRGKTVFFRPWPLQPADSQAFEEQSSLFLALREPGLPAGEPPPWSGRERAGLLVACLACVLVLAYVPSRWAIPAVCALPPLAWWAFQGGPAGTALAYGVAALLMGLGWRLQRLRLQRWSAERLLYGMAAARHQVDWRRRLRRGTALPVAYAVVGPRALMRGPDWEAWMDRWGALMDEGSPGDGLGLILAEPGAAEAMSKALLDLRRQMGGISGAVSLGTLSLRVHQRLGACVWQIHGPVKEGALELFPLAQAGQMLLSKKDWPGFRDFVECRDWIPRPGPLGPLGQGQVMNILGPGTNLWERRP